ncbi:unnamed protein product, partial [Didymodactylos carnosus]
INAQELTITSLYKENTSLKAQLAKLGQRREDRGDDEEPHNEDENSICDHFLTEQLEKVSLQGEQSLIAQMSLLMDDDCNQQLAIDYSSSMLTNSNMYRIKAKKIRVDSASNALYQSARSSLQGQKNETLLFYSGHSDHLDVVADAGFTSEDFVYGNFGKGLYFNSNICDCLVKNIGEIQKVLLCKVALGKIDEIMINSTNKISSTRKTGFDSVKILSTKNSNSANSFKSEHVIFSAHLAIPLFLLTFQPAN